MQRLDVRGRTSVITGAASGMGAEVARELDRRGARLALLDRNADGLAALAAELPEPATPPTSWTSPTTTPCSPSRPR